MTTSQHRTRAMVLADVQAARLALRSVQAADPSTHLGLVVAEVLDTLLDAAPDDTANMDVPAAAEPLQAVLEAKRCLQRALAGAATLHEISCFGLAAVTLRAVLDRAAQ